MYPPTYGPTIDAKPIRKLKFPRTRKVLAIIGKAIVWIISMIAMGLTLYLLIY